jgi:transcriptional regulator with XRE-family HTH domain
VVKLSRLKVVRERKALTQEELARASGVSRPTIARIETGDTEPYPSTTRKLAQALGVDPGDLMETSVEDAG